MRQYAENDGIEGIARKNGYHKTKDRLDVSRLSAHRLEKGLFVKESKIIFLSLSRFHADIHYG